MAKNISISPPKNKNTTQTKASTNTSKSESGKIVDLNFKVSAEFKKEIKQLALDLELTQKQVFEKAVQALKDKL